MWIFSQQQMTPAENVWKRPRYSGTTDRNKLPSKKYSSTSENDSLHRERKLELGTTIEYDCGAFEKNPAAAVA
jgi:hypothetical protein